jgi:hypothetical protein
LITIKARLATGAHLSLTNSPQLERPYLVTAAPFFMRSWAASSGFDKLSLSGVLPLILRKFHPLLNPVVPINSNPWPSTSISCGAAMAAITQGILTTWSSGWRSIKPGRQKPDLKPPS